MKAVILKYLPCIPFAFLISINSSYAATKATTKNAITSIKINCPTKDQIAEADKTTGTGIVANTKLYITTIKIKGGLAWITYYQDPNALDNLPANAVINSKRTGPQLQQVICTYGNIHVVAGVTLPNSKFNCTQNGAQTITCK